MVGNMGKVVTMCEIHSCGDREKPHYGDQKTGIYLIVSTNMLEYQLGKLYSYQASKKACY